MSSDLETLTSQLQARKVPYAAEVAAAALVYRDPDKALDFALDLAAITDRESIWGAALKPKGPMGTGDWTARVGHWLTATGVKQVDELPAGWYHPKDSNGNIRPGPYAIPEDELGFGRSICQIDLCSNYDWCQEKTDAGIFKWQDVKESLLKCGAVYDDCTDAFPDNKQASFASYNTGVSNVKHSIANGRSVDRNDNWKKLRGRLSCQTRQIPYLKVKPGVSTGFFSLSTL